MPNTQLHSVISTETLSSLPQLSLAATRPQILAYFKNTWALTEMLFSGLANEAAYYQRPYHHLRHPMIFYYAHPVVLYVNKLRVSGLWNHPINPEFESLFEVGVDEMRWDDMHEHTQFIWPAVDAVRRYRDEVYARMCHLIETHPLLDAEHAPVTQASPLWALFMAFEHERIHLETSSVLMRELPIDMVRKPERWPASYVPPANHPLPVNRMISQPACAVNIGKPQAWPSFGWDNEYGQEIRNVRPFEASQYLISNGEFLEFVKAGGYAQPAYWSREGWEWRSFRHIKHPTFWVQDGPSGSHRYALRTIFEVIAMPVNWPVCVNFYEAKAYCVWASARDGVAVPYRLLTEAEHHAIRVTDAADAVMHPDLLSHGYNMNLATGSETDVNALAPNKKGFHDSFGNVWQWCEDHFHPLSGSAVHHYYDDFSTPCYDGKHQMILGASFISTGDLASKWARFHFRPHFFQHAGFRMARSTDGNPASGARVIHKDGALAYQSNTMLNRYMLMHWGADAEIYAHVPQSAYAAPKVVHLPITCAKLVARYVSGDGSALDLGCAVARSSFEMARHFKQVVGIDYSEQFVDAAQRLQADGRLDYQRVDSGAQSTLLTAVVEADIERERLRFEQGDACALPLHLQGFDAVLMANLLCRLPDPVACLERLQGVNALVKPGGIIVMTTPFSWLEEYTPRSHWLGGVEDVQRILTEFELLYEEELPFVIREHQRKFEYIITKASVWRRKQ